MTGNDDQKRNPWGRPPSGQSPWGENNNKQNQKHTDRDSNQGPDLDDLLRRARASFNNPLGNNGRGVFIAVLIAILLWVASGIYLVDTSENAVITRFGNYTRTQTLPGLSYHMPWPIEAATKLNVTLDRRVQIGFSDTGYANASRRDIAEESLMLTADANIVDIDVVVLWNVAEAEKYLFNIRNPEQTIKRVAESAIREAVGQTRLQSIITQGRDDVAVRIQKSMQAILDGYKSGVAIKQVLIQEATVHPEVLEAYNDVAASRQDAERFQNEATIYKNDIVPKARGEAIKMLQDAQAYKQEVIARAEGDAQRFSEILEAYRQGKEVTRDRLYIETMEIILSNANRMVIDQEAGSSGVVPVLNLDNMKRAPEPTTPLSSGQ